GDDGREFRDSYAAFALLSWIVRHTLTVILRESGGTQYAAAPRLITTASGILGRPVKPGDDGLWLRGPLALLRRLLRHRWCGAGYRGPAHVARLRLVVAADPVHGLAVVPHHEVMQRPFVDMDELRTRSVFGEVAQQQPSLRHAHAAHEAGMRGQIQRFAAM